MNTALLVLRLVPGILLMGHGLQKLVPPGYSPPLLHAGGHRAAGGGFEQLGIRPGIAAAVLAGTAELVAGFSLAAGLVTPVGTILVGSVMTTAILTAHVRNGIWNAEGGFEFPLLLLALSFVITALGAGSYSIDRWADVDNWAGIQWSLSPVAQAAIALAIGVAAGLIVAIAVWSANRTSRRLDAHAGDLSRAR
jgi:putative oxidoreductase